MKNEILRLKFWQWWSNLMLSVSIITDICTHHVIQLNIFILYFSPFYYFSETLSSNVTAGIPVLLWSIGKVNILCYTYMYIWCVIIAISHYTCDILVLKKLQLHILNIKKVVFFFLVRLVRYIIVYIDRIIMFLFHSSRVIQFFFLNLYLL